jgi:hypothetical protein
MNLKVLSVLCLSSCVLSGGYTTIAYDGNINEIRIDPPGNRNDEYFELKGSANESLVGLSYILLAMDQLAVALSKASSIWRLNHLKGRSSWPFNRPNTFKKTQQQKAIQKTLVMLSS